jgi:hypothetical protein
MNLKFLTLISLLGIFGGTLQAETCDPKEIEKVIELAHIQDLELNRQRGLSWLRIEATPEIAGIGDYVNEEGLVKASAIEVILTGDSCSALADSVVVNQGERWLTLRVAGENSFEPRYYQGKLAIDLVDIGFELILFQRAFCNVTVNALVYRNTHPALRLPPMEDPQC